MFSFFLSPDVIHFYVYSIYLWISCIKLDKTLQLLARSPSARHSLLESGRGWTWNPMLSFHVVWLCTACRHVFMHSWVTWLFPHQSMAAVLPWRPLLARLSQILNGCTLVPWVSASSDLMALLDIFRFPKEVSMTCLSSATTFIFPRPSTASTVFNVICSFVLLQKRPQSLETPVCLESFTFLM